MRAGVGGRLSVVGWGRVACLAAVALLASCSIPSLEDQDCREARDIVREFYSFHFGNNLRHSAEDIEARRNFLTPKFSLGVYDSLRDVPGVDPFTLTDDPPKAFRVGGCQVVEAGKRTKFGVLLFWKDDSRSEQRSIEVWTAMDDGKWRIDGVSKQDGKSDGGE